MTPNNALPPVSGLEFEELSPQPGAASGADAKALQHLKLDVSVRVGTFQASLQQLFEAKEGEVLTLREAINSPVELLVNGVAVGRGHLVAVGDQFGVQITEPPRLRDLG